MVPDGAKCGYVFGLAMRHQVAQSTDWLRAALFVYMGCGPRLLFARIERRTG
jgi:hypothetical protein